MLCLRKLIDFLQQPDLPYRLKENIPLAAADRETFYAPYMDPQGYLTYPFCKELVNARL